MRYRTDLNVDLKLKKLETDSKLKTRPHVLKYYYFSIGYSLSSSEPQLPPSPVRRRTVFLTCSSFWTATSTEELQEGSSDPREPEAVGGSAQRNLSFASTEELQGGSSDLGEPRAVAVRSAAPSLSLRDLPLQGLILRRHRSRRAPAAAGRRPSQRHGDERLELKDLERRRR